MRVFATSLLSTSLALALLPAAPARADEGADLSARIRQAMANVKSFEVSVAGPNGLTGSTVVVLPDLTSTVLHFSNNTVEVVGRGTTAFVRFNGSVWRPQQYGSNPMKGAFGPLLDPDERVTVLPDLQLDGVTFGSFSYRAPPMNLGVPLAAMTNTCIYDKTTFLTKSCSATIPEINVPVTMTYGKWNDPSNVVVLPADPAQSVSPAPAAPSPAPSSGR